MSIQRQLSERSNNACELCGSTENLNLFIVTPKTGNSVDEVIHTCGTCSSQISEDEPMDSNHWRCLNDSMWSEVDAVKVVSYRMLHRLKSEGWPNDLLDMMYLDEEVLAWANTGVQSDGEVKLVHRDSNGVELFSGDSVTVIKDLNVKGSSLVAKRGTAVRNITLVHDNHEQIEGKVEGQRIVLLTQYVKK